MSIRTWLRRPTNSPRLFTQNVRLRGFEALEDRRLLSTTEATGGGEPLDNMQPSLGLNYVIATVGIYPARERGGEIGPVAVPADEVSALAGLSADPLLGAIGLFAGTYAPRGWAFADGQLLPISENAALFSILGTTYGGDGRTTFALPDLRGRAPIHVGAGAGPGLTDRSLGETVGVEQVAFSVEQLAAHSHTISAASSILGTTEETGGGQPHDNMQPSLGLNFVIATAGLYPSRSRASDGEELAEPGIQAVAFAGLSAEPLLGSIGLFAGNYAPRDWAFADGQLLSISENTALFSLLGTTYGGDGETTFALPDLRGRTPIHVGAGAGLSDRSLGETVGVEEIALTVGQIPAHSHTIDSPSPALTATDDTGGGQPHANMQPSLGLNFVIATQGLYPSQQRDSEGEVSALAGLGAEGVLGSIGLFAGNFAPRGWAFADGQLLPINQNTALFSLLGTTYGGDGITTFALPDLRGRTAIHVGVGAGPGLTDRSLGETLGAEQVTLTVEQLPAHSHEYAIADTIPPQLTVPVEQTIMEDTASGPLGIMVDDLDSGPDNIVLAASSSDPSLIPNGNLILGGSGSARTINIVPVANQSGGPVQITITATDPAGNIATATFPVLVTAVNDPPVNTVPGAQSGFEDVPLAIEPISVFDLDADEGTGLVQVTLTADHGTLTVDQMVPGGLAAADISGNGTASVTLLGSQSAINTTLAAAGGLVYLGSPSFSGADTLSVTTSDLGNTGTPGALVDSDTVPIHIASTQEQTEDVEASIDELVSQGALNHGEAQGMLSKLAAATAALDRGQPQTAMNTLGALLNHIEALHRAHKLDDEQAAALIEAINTILLGIAIDGEPEGAGRVAAVDAAIAEFDGDESLTFRHRLSA